MAVKFTPGAVLKVPAGADDFAYGVMLSQFPFMAFFDKKTTFEEGGKASEPPMFIVLVAQAAYAKGGWGKAVQKLPIDALPPLPRMFWQDPMNKYDCKIVEPDDRRLTAAPADCVGLEPEAIWAADHIESRIADSYAGRPNIYAESLRVKIP